MLQAPSAPPAKVFLNHLVCSRKFSVQTDINTKLLTLAFYRIICR